MFIGGTKAKDLGTVGSSSSLATLQPQYRMRTAAYQAELKARTENQAEGLESRSFERENDDSIIVRQRALSSSSVDSTTIIKFVGPNNHGTPPKESDSNR